MDLIQAEAVADLVDAATSLQARVAFDQLEGTLTTRIGTIESALFDLMARLEASLDFPEEGFHFVERGGALEELTQLLRDLAALQRTAVRGRLIREGAQIAIVGAPNVGRSSLFNALLNVDRAIVTPVAGTTRDLLTERAVLNGLPVGLVDTAGLRSSADPVEQEGIARARRAAAVADLTIVLLDRSRPLAPDDHDVLASTTTRRRLIVANKIDLAAAWDTTSVPGVIEISVRSGEGVQQLVDQIGQSLGGDGPARDEPLVTNVRHAALLERATAALERARELVTSDPACSEEFLLADLQDAAAALQEITGERTTDDLLARIFERFCIGK
jgi:tRNA modification GTPase